MDPQAVVPNLVRLPALGDGQRNLGSNIGDKSEVLPPNYDPILLAEAKPKEIHFCIEGDCRCLNNI